MLGMVRRLCPLASRGRLLVDEGGRLLHFELQEGISRYIQLLHDRTIQIPLERYRTSAINMFNVAIF